MRWLYMGGSMAEGSKSTKKGGHNSSARAGSKLGPKATKIVPRVSVIKASCTYQVNHCHRLFGYAWALLMAGTAFTAVFMHQTRLWGSYSPIHLLIPVTLVSLFLASKAARQGDINRHKVLMISLFALALVVTGLFTLLPGRVMNTTLFGAVHI